jgi:tRNA G18 (ribose-2'-O)-methylase SpoU
MRGYFSIGVVHGKNGINIGTLFRSALTFNASYIFTVGKRYSKQSSDTAKTFKSIPLFHFKTIEDLKEHLPYSCCLVGIEIAPKSISLDAFYHPKLACYLLGAEDHGLTKSDIEQCHHVVTIPGNKPCLNVSVAGSIVMYDRFVKELKCLP